MEICTRLDIPATPIVHLDDLPQHSQLSATALFQTMEHPSEGTIRFVRPTTKFSDTPASVRRAAPALGEHSSEVLRQAGFSETEVDALAAKSVIKHPGGEASEKRIVHA